MNIKIDITKADLEELVRKEIARRLGDIPLDKGVLSIETRSAQNFRSEWEVADFRASYTISWKDK